MTPEEVEQAAENFLINLPRLRRKIAAMNTVLSHPNCPENLRRRLTGIAASAAAEFSALARRLER